MQGLAKLLADHAPGCFKEQSFDSYFGRKIAIDASQHIYAFLVGKRPCALAEAAQQRLQLRLCRWWWVARATSC